MDYIITFQNTNHAIKGENYLLAENIGVSVLPLPSEIKKGCGICLKVNQKDLNTVMFILNEKAIPGIVMYVKDTCDGETNYHEFKGWSP